jgi:signal peptidase I
VRTLGRLLVWLFVIGGVAFIGLRWFFIDTPEIYSDAMLPTIVPGDMLVVNKRRLPERGEVALFEPPSRPGALAVRRVVGLPGDSVEVTRTAVRVNDKVVRQGTFAKRFARKNISGYFMLAERTMGHADSRHFGAVSRSLVRGTVTHVLFPSKARAKRAYFQAIDPPPPGDGGKPNKTAGNEKP